MKAVLFNKAQYIEEKTFNRRIKTLVVKKHTRDVTKILAIYILKGPIHFKESYLRPIFSFRTSVYFVSRWMPYQTFFRMLTKFLLFYEETEAEITNIKAFAMIFLRQRGKVPGLKPIHSNLYRFNCLYFCCIEKLFNILIIPANIFIIIHISINLFFFLQLFYFLLLFLHLVLIINSNVMFGYPTLITTIKSFVMNIVLVSHRFL